MAKKLLKRMLQKKNIIKNLTGMKYLSVFSPNAGKCGKNADQNNSEYGHLLRNKEVFGKTTYVFNLSDNSR